MNVWSVVVDVIVVAGSLVAVLDYFGVKPKPASGGSRGWKLIVMLAMVALSLALTGYSFYRSLRPKIVERIVERPVEKLVPQNCPQEPVKKARTGAKAPTATSPSIQQSNSGGVNVQQATTGEHSPIIDSPITIGNVPKHISEQDNVNWSEFLLRAKATSVGIHVRVSADQYTRSSPFVDEFYLLVKAGQWPMKEDGVNEIMGFAPATTKRFKGAEIIVRGEPLKEGEKVTVHEPDPVYYLGIVLDGLKIPTILRRDQNAEEGLITIQFEGGLTN